MRCKSKAVEIIESIIREIPSELCRGGIFNSKYFTVQHYISFARELELISQHEQLNFSKQADAAYIEAKSKSLLD